MAISFYPKPGMVLMCNFKGYIAPEIIKTRPVVVVSPAHMSRPHLVTVVPLSTTPPDPVKPYHYRLNGNPIPGEKGEVWAKCDLVASVCLSRLDRVKLPGRNYVTGAVSMNQVRAIRCGILASIGIDLADPLTYNLSDSR